MPEYINPDWTGSSDGTKAFPWKSAADVNLATATEVLWKADSPVRDVLPSFLDLSSTSGITFGYYGSGALPRVASYTELTDRTDWVETAPDSNIWVWDANAALGRNIYDDYTVLAYDTIPTDSQLRSHLTWNQRVDYYGWGFNDTRFGANAFQAIGEWDSDIANPSLIAIYCDENPIDYFGKIYVCSRNLNRIFQNTAATPVSNLTIDSLNLQLAYSSARFLGTTGNLCSNILVQNLLIEFMNRGFWFGGYVEDHVVQDNEIWTAGNVGILLGGTTEGGGNLIRRNDMYNCGYEEGIGAIYGAPTANFGNELIISENMSDKFYKGVYWKGEGFPFYFERASAYIQMIGNWAKNQNDVEYEAAVLGTRTGSAAYHFNGSQVNTAMISNRSTNCAVGMNTSDANPVGDSTYSILYNNFEGVNIAITLSSNGTAFNHDIDVKGNVATANPDNPGDTYGLFLDADLDGLVTAVKNDNNWLYGFDHSIYRVGGGAVQTSEGANTVTDRDPLLLSDATIDPKSPALTAGVYDSDILWDFNKDARNRTRAKQRAVGAYGFNPRIKSPIGLIAK